MSTQVNSTTVNDVYLNRNVGYTVVDGGNIHIENGIVSGFSVNDYLSLPANPSYNASDAFEWNIRFTTPSEFTTSWLLNIITSSINCGIYYATNKNIFIPIASGSAYGEITSTNLQENTTYIVNVVKQSDGNVISTLKDANGQVIKQQTKNIGEVSLSYSTHKLGTSASLAFSGSIDLNNTYIKVNGITWFNGKETASSTVNEVYYNKNCGYTVVGTPTINNGVVSGFSVDDYILLPSIPTKSISELIIKIKLNSSALGQNVYTNFLRGPSSFQGFTYCGTNAFNYSGFNIAGLGDLYINRTLQPNTDYWLKYTNNGTNCTAWWSEDGINYTAGNIKEASLITDNNSGTIRVGSRVDRLAFPGSIDLNNTYIKINGITWFNGKQAASNAVWTRGA